MNLRRFNSSLVDIKTNLLAAEQQKLNLEEAATSGKWVYDFKFKKAKYYVDTIKKTLLELNKDEGSIQGLKVHNPGKDTEVNKLGVNVKLLKDKFVQPSVGIALIDEMQRLLRDLNIPEKENELTMDLEMPQMPAEISGAVLADVEEMKRCYEQGCYRSAVILCGRVLETALHRKHYDVTGIDALEKTPGIGLGKLVAKLKENKVDVDPAIMQQIHLINEARIFSVHTKQTVFKPTPNQTHAVMLYTLDIVKKIFG